MRQRARRDNNHAEIVRAVEGLGASWFDTSSIGGGLDGILGVAGIDQRIEIKNPNALRGKVQALSLTTAEEKVFNEWQGRKPVVVESVDDVIKLINKLRREPHVSRIS